MTEEERLALSGEIRVLSGSPAGEELAAITAVLSAAFDELSHSDRRVDDTGLNGWRRSQLGLRRPLPHGDWVRSGWH